MSSPIPSCTVLSEIEIPALVIKLHSHLPYSLPLYRRLQFHLLRPNPPSARACISIASSHSSQTWLYSPESPSNIAPWLASHIDLSHTGQTQVWIFASWEVPLEQASPSTPPPTPPSLETRVSLLTSLFSTLSQRPIFIPSLPINPPPSHTLLERSGKYTTPYSRHKVLIGALHEDITALIHRPSISRINGGYLKYLFSPSAALVNTNPATDGLPLGYRFGPISDQYLQIVLDRTAIPRTIETLKSLGSVGLFYDDSEEDNTRGVESPSVGRELLGEDTSLSSLHTEAEHREENIAVAVSRKLIEMQGNPVGWGFLGKDASLTSLHTEAKHRGKNLAVAVSKKLIGIQGDVFKTPEIPGFQREEVLSEWAHADVSERNMESRRVMEKLGGKVGWRVAWVEVDLEKIELGR